MYFTDNIAYLRASWKPVSKPWDKEFSNAWQIVHQAVQFLAITGKSVFPPRFDDSHTSFLWDFDKHCFASGWMHGKRTLRLEFDPCNLDMHLVPYGEPAIGSFSLVGKTKKEIYALLRGLLSSGGLKMEHFITDMHYDLPAHEVCSGGRYAIHDKTLHAELAKHYSNAYLVLHMLNGKAPGGASILCWPHHFDLSIQLNLAREGGTSPAKIEVGFAPANPDAREPHFFVRLLHPADCDVACVRLKYGQWYPPPRTGTVLLLSKILTKKSAGAQAGILSSYLRESFDLLRKEG